MIHSLKRFLQLDPADRRLVLLAVPMLLSSILRLKLFGFNRAYARSITTKLSPVTDLPARKPDEYARAIRRVSNGLGVGTCLSRSLALRELLRRDGIQTEFRIGVDKKGGEFSAHAWLEFGGQPVGEVVPDEFQTFTEFR